MKGSLCRLAETSFLWRDTAMRIRERFNPHAPFEARRRSLLQRSSCWANFNPRAPCGARLLRLVALVHAHGISTHAPFAGRDIGFVHVALPTRISTHAPLAGRDSAVPLAAASFSLFQPTRPLRGATLLPVALINVVPKFQPTHPLRGATAQPAGRSGRRSGFQPTRPLRGATHA